MCLSGGVIDIRFTFKAAACVLSTKLINHYSGVSGTAIAQLAIDLYQNESCDEDLLLQIVLADQSR